MAENITRKKEERGTYMAGAFKAEAISSKSMKFDVYNHFVSHIKELGEAYKSRDAKKKAEASKNMLYFLKTHKLIYESIFDERIKKIQQNTGPMPEDKKMLRINNGREEMQYMASNNAQPPKLAQAIDNEIEFIFLYLALNKQKIALNIETEDIINSFGTSAKISPLINEFVANFREFKQEFELDHKQMNTDRLINTAIDFNLFLQNISLDYIIKIVTGNNQNTFLDMRLKLLQKTLTEQLMENSNEKEDPKVTQGVNESVKSLLEIVAENIETIKYTLTNIEANENSMISSKLRL